MFQHEGLAGTVLSRPSAAPAGRYRALDGLRGICAVCVCLFHFPSDGPIANSVFIQGSWLFVDFFFVLSGFIIAAVWSQRLTSAREAVRFGILRLGRVYPLHLAMLAAFVVAELVGLILHDLHLMQRPAFEGGFSLSSLALALGFAQIFGLAPGLPGWNSPSWSIAAEFWTYLLFAALVLVGRSHVRTLLLATAVISAAVLALLSPHGINATFQHSLWRCLYGFAVGALVWHANRAKAPLGGTTMEAAVIAAVLLFVMRAQEAPANLAAPLVFAVTVRVFSAEAGQCSRLLNHHWLQALGLWSFAIYMVHSFVQTRLEDVLRLLIGSGRLPGLTMVVMPDGSRALGMGGSAFTEALLIGLMLALVLIAAALAQRLIEQPGQRLARRLA